MMSIFSCSSYVVMALHCMPMPFFMDFNSTVSSETMCILALINILFLHLFNITEVLHH